MDKIYCTYCWQTHYAKSIEDWIKTNHLGCGKDINRYFIIHQEYIDYVRQYEANDYQHTDGQMRMF